MLGSMSTTGPLRRWWRATLYLVVEGAAGFVSLALLPVGVLLAVFIVIGPGWLVAPRAVRILRWWAGLARTRTGRFVGESVSQSYPMIPEYPTFTHAGRLLTAYPTRRDAWWVL